MPEIKNAGLSRNELEFQLNWLLRGIPKENRELAGKIGDILITLIEKNNIAIEKSFAQLNSTKLNEEY